MFDPETAIANALENATDLSKLQEKESARIKGVVNKASAQRVFGERAVDIALSSLKRYGEQEMTPEIAKQVNFEIKRLAEGYALRGDLELAIETYPHPEYQQKLDAVKRDGAEWCDCHGRNLKYIKAHFLYKGRERTLTACNKCGFENA